MLYHDVEQGSELWFRLRLGVPTASNFDMILTPAKGEPSTSQRKFIAQLIGETLAAFLPANAPNYTSRAIDWGQQTEKEARDFYGMERDTDVSNGGFVETDDKRFGCSPDGLIGLQQLPSGLWVCKGGLELKCPQPTTHAGYLMDGQKVPHEYRWQVQGELVVTGARWWDFMSYCPGLPPLLVRVEPNGDTDRLRVALDRFHGNYVLALAKVRGK
jgi:hypothetical protein